MRALMRGESHVEDIPSAVLGGLIRQGLRATTDYDELADADAIVIALPTPLSSQREPDLSIVLGAVEKIGERLRMGQLVVIESTTYPGTTREEVLPVLEARSGLQVGRDFNLAFSPERVDPGRTDWTTKTVPKVVGGITASCTERAAALYAGAVDTVHPVSTPEVAELTKLLENIFRSVNIALVNEPLSCAIECRSTCGRSSTRLRRNRSASCVSSQARDLGGIASRSIPST